LRIHGLYAGEYLLEEHRFRRCVKGQHIHILIVCPDKVLPEMIVVEIVDLKTVQIQDIHRKLST